MTNGWVRNWRRIEDWERYATPNMAHLFQHLIRRANHKPKQWQGIQVATGQLITSVASLRAQTGLSTRTVRTCLERLKSTNDLAIETTSQYTMITVCHYSTYQPSGGNTDKRNDKPPDKRPTNDRQTTDNKQECKELKNDKKKEKEEQIFEWFREAVQDYPGNKRGAKTEFENLKKKHKDWALVAENLASHIAVQIMDRAKLAKAGDFVPNWKNLQTYINNRSWESRIG